MGAVHDDQLHPIGDVARRTGLGVSAIRFYADAGHRLYEVDAIARPELVRTLRDLATTHLALVEGQLRHLRARRAVPRTTVNQHTATERVALMHDLVPLSDDDRDRLLDGFWDEVTDGLTVHPSFAEQLHRMRPTLPGEPTTEQLQAWIEPADLVRDDAFRRSVRRFFHDAFSSSGALEVTTPAMTGLVEAHRLVEVEAWESERWVAAALGSAAPGTSPHRAADGRGATGRYRHEPQADR